MGMLVTKTWFYYVGIWGANVGYRMIHGETRYPHWDTKTIYKMSVLCAIPWSEANPWTQTSRETRSFWRSKAPSLMALKQQVTFGIIPPATTPSSISLGRGHPSRPSNWCVHFGQLTKTGQVGWLSTPLNQTLPQQRAVSFLSPISWSQITRFRGSVPISCLGADGLPLSMVARPGLKHRSPCHLLCGRPSHFWGMSPQLFAMFPALNLQEIQLGIPILEDGQVNHSLSMGCSPPLNYIELLQKVHKPILEKLNIVKCCYMCHVAPIKRLAGSIPALRPKRRLSAPVSSTSEIRDPGSWHRLMSPTCSGLLIKCW